MEVMIKPVEEWFLQSEYDFATAEYMFSGGRYFYAVFMCHLSIEKAMKGLYTQIKKDQPPKLHNLKYFLLKLGLDLPEDCKDFIIEINDEGTATRYPESLNSIKNEFPKETVSETIERTRKVLICLKEKLKI